jgi:hypothetical protein
VRREGFFRRLSGLTVAALGLAALCAPAITPPQAAAVDVGTGKAAQRVLGSTRSTLPWHSGAWTGGNFNTDNINRFGEWRGTPADIVTTYSNYSSYQGMRDPWSITTWAGFKGKLNYGLALVPTSGGGSLSAVAAGEQDETWRTVARNLRTNGRGDSVIRLGWESNLPNWPWQATTDSASEFKAAFRHVVKVMKTVSPDLTFEFGVACGAGLSGSSDRLAPLTKVYPGDDVVDLVGCDTYDWWTTHPTSDANVKSNFLRPASGPGVQDVADFARAHGKGASYAEWGTARSQNGNNAGGDNPYFIQAMWDFLWANRDVVAFESYFDEPSTYISSSIFGAAQNPQAAALYRKLW